MAEHYGPRTVQPEIVPQAPSAFPPRPEEMQQEQGTEFHTPDEVEPRVPVEPSTPAPPPAPRVPDPRG